MTREPADLVHGMPDGALLQETDELLDRLGARSPRADDLDDLLTALLAEDAAGTDLDAVPADQTRRVLSTLGVWPPRQDLSVIGRPNPDDDTGPSRPADPFTELFGAPDPLSAVSRPSLILGADRTDRTDRISRADRATLAGAQPRVLGLRLVPALAIAASAVTLSMGAAAALSGGATFDRASQMVSSLFDRSPSAPAGTSPTGSDRMAGSADRSGAAGDVSTGNLSSSTDPAAGPMSTPPAGSNSPAAGLDVPAESGGTASGSVTEAPAPAADEQSTSAAPAATSSTAPAATSTAPAATSSSTQSLITSTTVPVPTDVLSTKTVGTGKPTSVPGNGKANGLTKNASKVAKQAVLDSAT